MDTVNATVDDMRAAFGLTDNVGQEADTNIPDDNNTEQSEQTEGTVTEEGGTNEPPVEENNTETDSDEKPDTPPAETPKNDFTQKQAQAFARLRTENSQMQKTLGAMAQILGIDPKLPADQLNTQLQAQARNALAKQNNMDPKILERLDYLEEINSRYQQSQNELKAQTALQEIKDEYGATDDDLKAFVNDLVKDQFDITTGDLKTAFIQRNFTTILERAKTVAVQAEQERATKASGASKPGTKQGPGERSEASDIKTVADLDTFLGNLK